MSGDLGTEDVANGVDQITSEHPYQIRDNLGLRPIRAGDASFGAGRSTVEHIFDCRVIIAKHLEHQRSLYHNFIDFKKAFDRVCHESLWKVLIGGTIDDGFINVIQAL